MQASPVSNSTVPSYITTITKSKEQILIQSECGCPSDLTTCRLSVNEREKFNVISVQCNQPARVVALLHCLYASDFVAKLLLQNPTGHMK